MLVHGVGDYHPGDYDDLLVALRDTVGGQTWQDVAVYPFFYDGINDWFVQKTQVKSLIQAMLEALKQHFDATALGGAAAECATDVVWPALVRDARLALREAFLAQLKQMVFDGRQAGVPRWRQKISIIAHSLGCFQTYEGLHAAVDVADHHLRPVSDGVQLERVIFFASPVKLIQTVALLPVMRVLIPNPEEMACLRERELRLPGELDLERRFVTGTRKWVAITGKYDPVGGVLFGSKLPWAYMDMEPRPEGFEAVVDEQAELRIAAEEQLRGLIQKGADGWSRPNLSLENPHSWLGYVRRNAEAVKACVA